MPKKSSRNYVIKQDESGGKEVVWRNTIVDKPTLQQINAAAKKHFRTVPKEKIYLVSGIMSLTLKMRPTIL